jgi:uncharacterized membrane protein YoaK (UPF0700 family)
MTGNVVFLAFAVAGTPGLSIARSLTSLLVCLAGAALGRRIGIALGHDRRQWLLVAAAAEAGLRLAAAIVSVGFDVGSASPPGRLYGLIVRTALAMGFRNATVRQLAVPDLTTTVLTLTLTAVAADSGFAGGRNPRLGRRIAAVAAMFAGAALGALLLRVGLQWPLVVSGACVVVAIVACRRSAAAEAV